MGSSLAIRSFVWGLCLAILLFGARTAQAAAPVCDESATSRIAPPPVLPIRDVKLEAGSPCDMSPLRDLPVRVAPIDPRAPVSPVVGSFSVATEAWVRPVEVRIHPPIARRTAASLEIFVARKPGFSPGVFRPPRG